MLSTVLGEGAGGSEGTGGAQLHGGDILAEGTIKKQVIPTKTSHNDKSCGGKETGVQEKVTTWDGEIREEVTLGDLMRRLPSVLSLSKELGGHTGHPQRASSQGAGRKAPESWRSPSELF